MNIRLKWLGYLLMISLILESSIDMLTNAYAQELQESLQWSVEISKQTFYPGEPVLLTINISNMGTQAKKIDFGADGIEAFTMELYDSNSTLVSKGDRIQRFGLSGPGILSVASGKIGQKSIVLNQWCSTLLQPGWYHIVCRVDRPGKFYLEKIKSGGQTKVITKRQYDPVIILELDIQMVKSDDLLFKKILEDLAKRAFKTDVRDKKEQACRRIAREMLAFTESPLAVPYQLHILKVEAGTRLKWDVINSLARSGTLEAAEGLMQIIKENEDCAQCIEDIKWHVIDAVYRLRETGNADIINATEQFVARYKRPSFLPEPMD